MHSIVFEPATRFIIRQIKQVSPDLQAHQWSGVNTAQQDCRVQMVYATFLGRGVTDKGRHIFPFSFKIPSRSVNMEA
ncbi:hypothetical protein AMECASPLE_014754 [Ameca splendens]|uniref:Uncharacterized protein n=1 Tax=Ameca splendens TaxID=208324 RepID=A0ABV0XET7_9TELE